MVSVTVGVLVSPGWQPGPSGGGGDKSVCAKVKKERQALTLHVSFEKKKC